MVMVNFAALRIRSLQSAIYLTGSALAPRVAVLLYVRAAESRAWSNRLHVLGRASRYGWGGTPDLSGARFVCPRTHVM